MLEGWGKEKSTFCHMGRAGLSQVEASHLRPQGQERVNQVQREEWFLPNQAPANAETPKAWQTLVCCGPKKTPESSGDRE